MLQDVCFLEVMQKQEGLQMAIIKIDRLTLNNFRFFTDDEKNNSFHFNGQNVLIYGENGSGKSSIFKAFEFLTKEKILDKEFEINQNIFNFDKEMFLKFDFTNKDNLIIDINNPDIKNNFDYLNNLIFIKPMLDYKNRQINSK